MRRADNAELEAFRKRIVNGSLVLLWAHVFAINVIAAGLGIDWTVPTLCAAVLAAAVTLSWWRNGSMGGTRRCIAVALVGMVSLVVAEFAGHPWQLDLHMYFFVALALLTAFCDPSALILAGGTIALQHFVMNFVLPAAIYPGGADLERVGLHAVVVALETLALVWLSHQLRYLFRQAAEREADKAATEQMRVERDTAEATTRAKSDFLATMSHEIRSPMSGLVGVIGLLRETKLDPDQERMAGMLHNSALTLLGVLNDVLDFSKIESGALSIHSDSVRLRELVTDLVQPHILQAAAKGVGLSLAFDPETPDCVEIDPLRLRQILNNLLSNAIKFTTAGQISLSVKVDQAAVAATLRFVVRDSGIGMSPEVVSRLFNPFMQADGSTSRKFGGTGLGLCISLRLARLLGGTMEVESQEGAGSLFTLLLPFIPASMPALPAIQVTSSSLIKFSKRQRVLVVDDDLTNRWASRRQLELLGLLVNVAEDGETALEMLRTDEYDLLLTDCHMPRMDGADLARALRRSPDPRLHSMPIVGLTADVTSLQRESCMAAGMNELVIKPVSSETLSALLSRLLRHSHETMHYEPSVPLSTTVARAPLPNAPSIFDDEIYRELFSPGDPEGEAWLGEYLQAAEHLADDIRHLILASPGKVMSRQAISATAHRLAGTSLSVGAIALGQQAREIEHAAARDEAVALRPRCVAVLREFAATKTAILAFIASQRMTMTA